MPIKIPNGLPAESILQSENISDICCLWLIFNRI